MKATTKQLDKMFTDQEQQLLLQALNLLLGVKQAAYEEAEIARMSGHPMVSSPYPFRPEDFGVPVIQGMIDGFTAYDDEDEEAA